MPLIALKLEQGLYTDANALVTSGDYTDIQQLVEVALRNQLQLEQRYRAAGGRATEISDEQSKSRARRHSPRPTAVSPPVRSELQQRPGIAAAKMDAGWPQIAAAFRFTSERTTSLEPCVVSPRPPDEQMYALVNRLFPLKLVARWLDVQGNTIGHWPAVVDASDSLGHDVEAFGSALATRDVITKRRREEQLATSLPRVDNPKSTERFLTQFVARQTDAGEIHPAGIVQFALACIKNGQLVLSREGQELSRIQNPLIDGDGDSVEDALTVEERRLFLHQIKNYMPGEATHLRAVLQAVSSGSTSPPQLIDALRARSTERATDAAFRSHLSGVIARAVDLRLLQRRWEGRYVFYSLTVTGSSVAADTIPHEAAVASEHAHSI
jgi:hypothetical protein